MKKTIFLLFISILLPTLAAAQTPVSYFGAIPDLKVSGNEFVDPTGKAVTLHGVMDTPSAYFNGGRWTNGVKWANYGDLSNITPCLSYFTKIFQAIDNPAKGTYCNLFRLHLDPCWATYDANVKASGFTESGGKVYDPHGNEVSGEASIYHFDMAKFKARMTDLYVPIIQDALAHGLYVVVRPPGVFPHDIWVGDYYNTFLTEIWDEISKNSYIKAHSGQIMLELGNEPVRIWKTGQTIPTVPATNKTLESTRGDAYNGHSEDNPVLADFFQPIVDKIRQNGFNGIILLPGTSYQANYNSYKKKAITDSKDNYGYAVHNYPGWYGGWDPNQTEAQFISTFESQVPVDSKPIVITEVDWSPEWRLSDKSHWNEEHTQFTAGNYGTWATGTTNGVTQGVDLVASQNIGWGLKYRHLVDKHPNISFTLQGTTTYVDMDAYLKDATVQPAFLTQMKADGYPDARQACSGYCFDWYKEFACGDRIPYGSPSVAPEVEPHSTTATVTGNAKFDDTNGHYIFYTPTYSSFTFKEYEGTPLIKCAEFTLNLGEGSTIGYRLDVQLKDANGNIIKYIDQSGAEQNYIIGSEDKGTRFTSPESKTYDFQTIFAEYLEQYPGCTVGEIRLNTVVEWGKDDSDKTGKYWFTIDKMDMNVSEVTARTGSKGTSLADVKMYKHEAETKYVYNNPKTLGGWYNNGVNATITNNNDGSYKIVVSKTGNAWEGQFNIGDNTYTDGTEYTLQLDIKGSVAGNIGVAIQKSEGYEGRGEFPSIPVTTSWQTVTVKATVNGEGADRILLNYGAYAGTLDIRNIKVSYAGDKATEITGNNIEFGEKTNGAEVFGAGLGGSVSYQDYSDLSAYKKMIIKGTGGTLRVLYNRPAEGTCPELNPSLASGEAIVDLSSYPYFHLNSIKAAWEQTVNVSSITLISGDGNDVEIADYYITGAGHITDAAQAALADVNATVIDATGLTNINPWSLQTANPNCLIIYKDDNQVGFTWNETTRNLVKNAGGYSAYRTNLYDGFNFRAPFAFNTFGGATYTRELTTEWATIALPFELNVAAAGSPEIYQLTAVDSEKMVFTKVESRTIAAGNVILYRNQDLGETVLSGSNIAQTAEGFNIQPLNGVSGWYTAQSFTNRVIDDVTTDPVLKDYEVYGVQADKFVHATKKITLKPFRAFFLVKKDTQAAAKASYLIATDIETTGISSTPEVQAPAAYYDISGRRINSSAKSGIVIIRKADGTVRKVVF